MRKSHVENTVGPWARKKLDALERHLETYRQVMQKQRFKLIHICLFRDLVTSLIADLARLAARRFILGPIASALGGILDGAGGLFANILHQGGMVGSSGPTRMVPAMAFAGAPRMHSGGWAGLRPDEVPAILQRGERVLSRREAQAYGAGGGVTINTRNAESFRQSRTQVAADIARAVSLGHRGL